MIRCWLAFVLIALFSAATVLHAQPADPEGRTVRVPGPWPTNQVSLPGSTGGYAWYRAWLKPHESFFTPHERNLFAESVTLNVRDLADAHEALVNGTRVGTGGQFPPEFRSGRAANHRHKIPPGLLRKDEWNEIVFRVYSESGAGGFLSEAPFVMDYFNECVLEGEWEWWRGDRPNPTQGPSKHKPDRAAFDQYHESNRVLGEAAQPVPGPKLEPAEAFAQLQPAEDLRVEQILHEPLVAQPTHLSFDARGRLWVAQYRQYPYPAGVKMLSRDKYYRAQYDRVPPPPPGHTRGRDRITIHEDTDGDGQFDRHKVFVDGLNLANAALPGRGGVWVMNVPYLLFYPDSDGDDVPDGPPTVQLAGFGLEDTHSVANGLVWGPDGWIYGGQGSTTSSRVVRPGLDPEGAEGVYFEGCMVWRYHPVTRDYELFAEGSGNVFGLEIDDEGRLFSGHNGPETRGWHYLQGGYYLKQGVDPGKFGPPRNPYAFGELPWMKSEAPIQRFTHMLAVVGGTALPSARMGQLFWIDPIHSLVLASERRPEGSTFGTRDLGPVLTSGDEGFRPVHIVHAPDGSLLVADFYEHYIAHGQHYQSQIDPTTGRIYRLRGRNSALERDVDLTKKSPDELLALLEHPNRWHRQAAVRLLAERAVPTVVEKLRGRLAGSAAPLEALWALHQADALDDGTARLALMHSSAPVREWTVRLLGDRREIPEGLMEALVEQARREPDVRVRAQMASSARRLPSGQALSVVVALMGHDTDVADPCVPLLCWWVLENRLAVDPPPVLALFQTPDLWERPLVREHLLPRLMRRFAVEGRRSDLLVCAQLLRTAPSPQATAQLLKGFEAAYRGRVLSGLPDELLEALGSAGHTSLALRVRQEEPAAVAEAVFRIQDPQAQLDDRLLLVRTLGEIRASSAPPVLLKLAQADEPSALRQAAFAALVAFEEEAIADQVLTLVPSLPAEVRPAALALLVGRTHGSLKLGQAVASGRLDAALISPDMVDRLRQSRDPAVSALAERVFPRAPVPAAAMTEQIAQIEAVLQRAPGNPYAGEAIFAERCAACHKLFFKGGRVGPDLTAYQRDNLGTLLVSILNPSAEIREGFAYVEVATTDGRVLGGFLTDRDTQVVVLRGLDGQDHTLRTGEIQSIEPTGRSLMPEGLLEGLSEEQLRDFFAFLRSAQPFSR